MLALAPRVLCLALQVAQCIDEATVLAFDRGRRLRHHLERPRRESSALDLRQGRAARPGQLTLQRTNNARQRVDRGLQTPPPGIYM